MMNTPVPKPAHIAVIRCTCINQCATSCTSIYLSVRHVFLKYHCVTCILIRHVCLRFQSVAACRCVSGAGVRSTTRSSCVWPRIWSGTPRASSVPTVTSSSTRLEPASCGMARRTVNGITRGALWSRTCLNRAQTLFLLYFMYTNC